MQNRSLEDNLAICISTDQYIDTPVLDVVLKASGLGDEEYLNLVKERI